MMYKCNIGIGLDLSQQEDLKTCMAGFSLAIVASVKHPSTPEEIPACQARLDSLEGDLQHRLRCLSEHGGMCIRDETKKKEENKLKQAGAEWRKTLVFSTGLGISHVQGLWRGCSPAQTKLVFM